MTATSHRLSSRRAGARYSCRGGANYARQNHRLDADVELVLANVGEHSAGPLQKQPQLGLGVRRPHMRHDPPTPSTYSAICTSVAPEAVRTRLTHATARA